ncbi:sugar phosphate isomerase/epimerase family protein [Actinomycetota bacterium]
MLKINACLGIQGATYNERYVPGGYFDEIEFEKLLEIVSEIEDVTGYYVYYPGHPLIDNPEKLKRKLADYNSKVSDIGAETWADRKWKYGTLTAKDKNIRKEAIKIIKHTMDLAVELNAHSVLVWPAHDGVDYAFQADFTSAWDYLIESLEEIGEYNPEVKIAVEYKQKDPRAKSYIENMAKLMLIIKSLKADNIGAALDLGHSFFAAERPAEALALVDRHNKLYQIHLNDNYRDADPDLLFGTINFWEILEFFYWLGKIEYTGWMHTDFTSPRDDRIKMFKLAIKFIRDFEKMAEKLNKHSDIIDKNLKDHNFVDNMTLIRELLFEK